MAVSVRQGEDLVFGRPVPLFDDAYLRPSKISPDVHSYDVAPDGSRFVLIQRNDQGAANLDPGDPSEVDLSSFNNLAGHLDLNARTSLHAATSWQNCKGEEVEWAGKVVDVKGGRGKAEIYVAHSSRPKYRGYNIILQCFDMERASKLSRGDRIRFKGLLYSYKGRRGNPVVVVLNSVEILGPDNSPYSL